MEERLAARAVHAPTERSAYHAITYGWLLAGLARRVTGQRARRRWRAARWPSRSGITAGLHIGVPEEAREFVAEPVGSALRHAGSLARVLAPLWTRAGVTRTGLEALLVPGFHRLFEGREPPIWTTEMPAVNGVFSARALARLYGALANGGATTTGPAPVAGDDPRARARPGPHRATSSWASPCAGAWATTTPSAPAARRPGRSATTATAARARWADPELGLSLGFVTNRIGSRDHPARRPQPLPPQPRGPAVRACAPRAAGR